MMNKCLIVLAALCYCTAEETRLLDLDPNDAQNLISQQDQTLKYAPKIDTDVPAVRFLGEEPHNVLEDLYLAKQYHGQDGLGGYLYGYQVPDIAKNEEKKPSGELKGAYNYINGAGQEIKVEYWDDGTGFHQKDNIPDIQPEEDPEVKRVKDEFLKRWQEEAERNQQPVQSPYNSEGKYASGPLSEEGQRERADFFAKQPPQPQNFYVQQNQQSKYISKPIVQQQQSSYARQQTQQYQGAASAQQSSFVQQPAPSSQEVIYANAEKQQKSSPQEQEDGAYNPDDEGKYIPGEDEENTGPPKGFFYAFDYPVGIITKDQGRALPIGKSEGLKQTYDANKQRFERQLKEGGASDSYLMVSK